MALVWSPCYRCPSCGSRDCYLTAPSIVSNDLWLLIAYQSPSVDRLLRCLSSRNTYGFDLHEEINCHHRMATLSLAMGSRTLRRQGQELTSRITGGNFLHALLHNFGKIYPGVIRRFISELSEDSSKTDGVDVGQWNGSDLTLLLQRDAFGNLPIHVASSVGVPLNVLRDLLLQTLKAQKSLLMGSAFCRSDETSSVGTPLLHSNAPYIMSTTVNSYSLLDIELMRFVDCYLHDGTSVGPCYEVTKKTNFKSAYHQILLDAVNQMNSGYGKNVRYDHDNSMMTHRRIFTSRQTISSLFLTRIKCVICAAYDELLWLVQRNNLGCLPQKCYACSCFWLDYRRDNVFLLLDWLPEAFNETRTSARKDGSVWDTDPLSGSRYVLHYASALSGPTVMLQNCSRSNRNVCNNHETATLLQVSRPFLDLLLEEDPVRACNVLHPATGQLPLHFGVQAGFSLFMFEHGNRFCIRCCELSARNRSNLNEWKEWIQKLIEIDPTTCCKTDYVNRTPLHYALLLCLQNCRACRDELDGSLCCCRRTPKCVDDRTITGSHMSSVGDCRRYCRSSECRFDEDNLNEEVICLLIRSNPESIEIPCPIRFCTYMDRTDKVEVIDVLPRGEMFKSYHDYSCQFEVFQVAAMVYPVISLNAIYSILRMCPSRCYMCRA